MLCEDYEIIIYIRINNDGPENEIDFFVFLIDIRAIGMKCRVSVTYRARHAAKAS